MRLPLEILIPLAILVVTVALYAILRSTKMIGGGTCQQSCCTPYTITDPQNLPTYSGSSIQNLVTGNGMWDPNPGSKDYRIHIHWNRPTTICGINLTTGQDGTHDAKAVDVYHDPKYKRHIAHMNLPTSQQHPKTLFMKPITVRDLYLKLTPNTYWQVWVKKLSFLCACDRHHHYN